MRKVNLLWTPLDYVCQPPLLEDFSILDKKVDTKTVPKITVHENTDNMANKQLLNPQTESSRQQAIRLKQLLHWSQEWTGSPPLNTSPLCECSEDSTIGSETIKITVDCKLHGHISEGRQSSIVLSQSSSRKNSFSDSDSSKDSSSSSSRRRDKNRHKTLISDPAIKASQKDEIVPRQATQNNETQFSLANWFLHTFSDRNRESAADRARLNVHKLPRHMKEQLKHIYVY